MSNIETFVSELEKTNTPLNLFNPYKEVCNIHDLPNAPAMRRRNLKRLLYAHKERGSQILWIFEAPSHLGARRSGAPFVNERNFEEIEGLLGTSESFEKATHGAAKAALTTVITWKLAQELKLVPLIWETLPFHPHQAGKPLTNRRPSSKEIIAYKHFLLEILEIFSPNRVLAIGRVAESALDLCGVEATYVRHPAQGGAALFRDQVKAISAKDGNVVR
jgi:uracil-DNA glycosylase